MPKNNYWASGVLGLLFQNTNVANIGDATGLRGSTGVGSLYVALHTADPGVAGNQTTNEIAYIGYARVAVARTSGGWTLTGNSVSPAANITFPAGTGGSGTATFFSVGYAASGAGGIVYSGTINPSIVCGNGITPVLQTGTAITEA